MRVTSETATKSQDFSAARTRVASGIETAGLPAEAVQRSSTGDFVYLVKPDNTVTLRDVVQGGQVDDSHVVISKGLQPGDKVVTEGQFRLKEGVKVIPLQPGQAPPEPTEAQLKAASEKRGGGGGRGGRGPR